MIYNNNNNNNDDDDDDDDACINDVIQIGLTISINFDFFYLSLVELLGNTFIFV